MAGSLPNFAAVLVARLTDPFRGRGLRWLAGVTMLILIPLGLALAYQRWGSLVWQNQRYAISPDEIRIRPPQPAWIYGDVKAEVVRDGSLQKLTSLDRGLSAKIIDAFEMHPWVSQVEHLKKSYPNIIDLKVNYRRPVAMVEVVDQGRRGVSPVDANGFVLPIDGFLHKLDRKENYLRLLAAPNMPPALEGTMWRDARIEGGARVAEAIGENWKNLGLYRIIVMAGSTPEKPEFICETASGGQLIWGRAPGQEQVTEPKAETKMEMLRAYVSEKGSLDKLNPGERLDLRTEGALNLRTARQPTGLDR